MDMFLVTSTWHVAELQAAATEVLLSAASHHVSMSATIPPTLASLVVRPIYFTFCISFVSTAGDESACQI